MRALVLGGAGAVCREATRDLARFSNFDEIVVADYDTRAAEQLVDDIGDTRLQVRFFDARDERAMRTLFPAFDVIVNGLPFAYDLAVNEACVEVGVNGLDLSSDDPQFDLHETAKSKGMLFVPGVGATPGITNMMVRRAAEILDRMDWVEIAFAAFRCLAPAPGLLETTLWEFNPDVEERQEVYYEDGEWHSAPPLSGGREIGFHTAIGDQIVYYVPHDEANTLPRSFPTLQRAAVRGCFPPHVMELMAALMRAGALSDRSVRIGEREMPSIEAVRALLADSSIAHENAIWAYGLVVEVFGLRDGRETLCTFRNHHPDQAEWGAEAAYYKNVGVPLSIGAQLIAQGETLEAGVRPPELAFPVDRFFEELAVRQITVEESIIERGVLGGPASERKGQTPPDSE